MKKTIWKNDKYVKHFKKDPEEFKEFIEPYTQALFQSVNPNLFDVRAIGNPRSVAEAFLNKTHAGEIAVAVDDITKRIMRDITVENLFNLAASQSFGAGVSQSQLETRMRLEKQMGKNLNEDFKGLEVDNSKKLWTSCFYLVIK